MADKTIIDLKEYSIRAYEGNIAIAPNWLWEALDINEKEKEVKAFRWKDE